MRKQGYDKALYSVNKRHEITGIHDINGNFPYDDIFLKNHARLYSPVHFCFKELKIMPKSDLLRLLNSLCIAVFLTCTIIIEAQQYSQDYSIEFNDYEESKEASADNEVDKEDDVGLAINCF